jgi:UDP-N-acetylmuramoyl-L-alanyl-D-glutamate--2,6-diaminopimelate ligase
MCRLKLFLKKTIFYPLYKKGKANLYRILYGNPQKDLFVIGVTWTDWKTTTVNLIQKILNDNLWPSASVSTALIKIWDNVIYNDKKMTSFDPKDLYWYLYEFKRRWIKYVVLEVSSHWLDQYRFHWIDFDMWVLTNISSEHLDYHKTIELYAETKKKLFLNVIRNKKSIKYAVLPKDDDFWRKWLDELTFDKVLDYWIFAPSTVKAENIKLSLDSLEFDIKYLWKVCHIKQNKLLWKHNVYNILAASSVWILLWIDLDKIKKSIESFEWLPWRLEKIERNWVIYFVDFAHTPKALESVLDYLNSIKHNWRLILIFWAPWNRDPFKRPIMWEIADKFADIIILTDDDPASENRYDIIYQVRKWINRLEWDNFYIIPERELAIKFAKQIARSGDIVLITWKWHELVQLTNFGKRKWSDVEEILKN